MSQTLRKSANSQLFFEILAIAMLCLASSSDGWAQMRFLGWGRPVITDQSMGLLAKSPTRTIVDLNGRWRCKEESDGEWFDVQVPSSYEGVHRVTFSREFTLDPMLVSRSVFQVVASCVSYYCEIRINGQFVGKHAGETSFSFKISPGILHAGTNTITVDVHNSLNSEETLPLREQLWQQKNFGGLLYDIALVASGFVWAQETSIGTTVTAEGKSATVSYHVLMNSAPVSKVGGDSLKGEGFGRSFVDHYIEVHDLQSGEMIARSETHRVQVDPDRLVPVDITLALSGVKIWSPESPAVYVIVQRTLRDGVLIDESYQQFGFRTVATKGASVLLNGAPYVIKGISYTETSPAHGRSLSVDEMERDVLIMKNLGVNAVRLTEGVVHPMFLSLCDRYGLLVFVDVPASNAPSSILQKMDLQATAKNLLREIIARDANHPCIVAFGLGRGIDGFAPGFETYIHTLAQSFRLRDSHLLYASFATPPPVDAVERLDVIGIDLHPTSAHGITQVLEAISAYDYSKPVLISSLQYPVEVGNYNGYSDPRSIDAQAQFFLEIYNDILARKYAGIIVSSFVDWPVTIPIMSVDRVQQFSATAGILDAWRLKRIAYDVLKAKFNNEKPPVLVVGAFSPEHPASFVVIGILLILFFSVVYNLFRRFRENVVRSFLRPHNFFSDVRDQRMLSIFQTSVVGMIGAISAALLFANILYFWRSNYFADAIISQVIRPAWLKQWLDYAAWNPGANIAVMTALLFLSMLVYAVLLRIVAFFMKKNLLLFDSFSVAMWCVLPMAILAPFGMVLYRIMDLPVLEIIAVLTYVGFHIWTISRLLKGTAIVLDVRPLYFYIGGYVVILFAVAMFLVSLNGENSTFAYFRYIYDVWSFLQHAT